MLRLASCSAASIMCIPKKSKKQPCRMVQGFLEVLSFPGVHL